MFETSVLFMEYGPLTLIKVYFFRITYSIISFKISFGLILRTIEFCLYEPRLSYVTEWG